LFTANISAARGQLKDCLAESCGNTGTWNGSGSATYTQIVDPSSIVPEQPASVVPEPASIALLALAG
jgi:hypothetical protein